MSVSVPNFGVVHDAPWLETCFHEAGHAVVAKVLGVPVLYAEVGGEINGHVVVDEPPLEEMTPTQVRDSQVISAAGGAASSLALVMYAHQGEREADRWARHPHCEGDRALEAEAARFPGAISAASAYTTAERILTERWGDVEGLAYRLAEQGRVNGGAV